MTRIELGLLANDVLILAVGYAFLFAVGLVRLGSNLLWLAGLSFLTGWAVLGTLLSLALMAGIPLEVWTTLVVASGAALACVAVGRRRRDQELPAISRPKQGRLAVVATVIGGVTIAIAAAAALVTAVKSEWDPNLDLLTAWLPRAEIIYYLHAIDPSQWSSFLDPWYPPLVPTLYATTFEFAGGFHPSLLSLQQAVLGVAFILAALAILDRVAPRWITFPSFAVLITAPWFWWRLTSLLPDQALAYMLGVAGLVTLLWLHDRRVGWLCLGTAFLCAATLTKLEGAAFAAILAIVIVVSGIVVHRRKGLVALVLLVGPLTSLLWRAWLGAHHVASSNSDLNQSQLTSPGFLFDRIHRLTYAIKYMLEAPWQGDYRTPAIIFIAVAVTIAVVRRITAITIAVIAWLTLSFLALAATYWTATIDLHFYVATSASRVGGTIIVSAATITPLLLGLALRSDGEAVTATSGGEGAVSAAED